jgi:ABC-type uncharacterized transport system permease subunit
MVLDLIVSTLGIILAIIAIELRDSINPGFLGLALVNVVSYILFLTCRCTLINVDGSWSFHRSTGLILDRA